MVAGQAQRGSGRRRTALIISGVLHGALLALVAGTQLEFSTDAIPEPQRVWLDGPVIGSQARGEKADNRMAGAPRPEVQEAPPVQPKAVRPTVRRSRRLEAPQRDAPVAIPSGTDVVAVDLAPAAPVEAGGGAEQGSDGPTMAGSGDGYGVPQGIMWGAGGWETDYGRQLASRIEREAEDAELGPRPLRLTKSLVVVVEVDPEGRLIRQTDGSLIRVLKSRVNEKAEQSLLAAVKRASKDFPPFPVQGAKDRFTLEVRFRVGPDGLSL